MESLHEKNFSKRRPGDEVAAADWLLNGKIRPGTQLTIEKFKDAARDYMVSCMVGGKKQLIAVNEDQIEDKSPDQETPH